jgi:LPXTG-motif cell wall-anchored protein
LALGVILTAKATNRRRSLRPFGGRDDARRARETQGERKTDTTTLLVIVFVVLLLGGGGFFYRRRT